MGLGRNLDMLCLDLATSPFQNNRHLHDLCKLLDLSFLVCKNQGNHYTCGMGLLCGLS